MTREEARAILCESKRQNECIRDCPSTFFTTESMEAGVDNAKKRIAALDIAISALTPPTQEQMERVWPGCELFRALYKQDMDDAATALAALQDENTRLRIMREWERNHRIHAEQHADALFEDCKELNAELESVKRAIHGDCAYCANQNSALDGPCKGCTSFAAQEFIVVDYWKWRGPEEE